jgi:hypothetical protein
MEKIITPLEIPGPLIPAVPPGGGNYFARVSSQIYDPSIPLFYHYLISSVLRLKETHEFEYIKNQVLINLGGIGSKRLGVVYKKNHKNQHSVNIAKFWLSFLNTDLLIKVNSLEHRKENATSPRCIPLFKIFNLMEEYKTDISSGKNSAEISLVGATNTTILRLSAKSGYFPVIEIQNLLNPLDTVLIKNEKDWDEFISEPKNQFDLCETELMEPLTNFYYNMVIPTLTEGSGKKSNIELSGELLTKINNYLNNWTRFDYGKVYNHLDFKIFEYLTKVLGAIEPRYALVTNNNSINLIKYD